MEELRQWIPIIVIIISNVVVITLSYASLRQKIALSDETTALKFKNIEEKLTDKFNNVEKQIGEIKDNHLHDLKNELISFHAEIKCLDDKFNQHLITHNR